MRQIPEEEWPSNGEALFANRYKLVEHLGRGGMAEVFRAIDTSLGIEVALKILHKHLSAKDKERERFLREARITRRIIHSNVVRTFDVGEEDEQPFFAMELLKGTNLKEILRAHSPLPLQDVISIAERILSGLEAVHACEVIHRDLKPSNIVFSKNGDERTTGSRIAEKKFGVIKITDFGVAREYDSEITQGGEAVGSAPYMAPEVWKRQELTAASDLYAFGVMFFEMLTGVLPFDGESAYELMAKHFSEAPPRASELRGDLPQWVDGYIAKLLNKNPTHRYKNAGEALSVLFRATAEPDTVQVEESPILTSRTYKQCDLVADDSRLSSKLLTSSFVTFPWVFSRGFGVVFYGAIGLAAAFFVPQIRDSIQRQVSDVNFSDVAALIAGFSILAALPWVIFANLVQGFLRSIFSGALILSIFTTAIMGMAMVKGGVSGIGISSSKQFLTSKMGISIIEESGVRALEASFLIPPNGLGRLVSDGKGTVVEKRAGIGTLFELLLLVGLWGSLVCGSLILVLGTLSVPGVVVSLLIPVVAALMEGYLRVTGYDLFGKTFLTSPLPLSISYFSLAVVVLAWMCMFQCGLIVIKHKETSEDEQVVRSRKYQIDNLR